MVEAKIINYKKALVEVDAVLSCLDYNEYKKIPTNIINAIENNKDEEYMYEYDEELEYEDWSLMPETKAILFNLFRDYLSTQEQKEKIIKMQAVERQKNERKKIEQYHSDLFANKQINRDIKEAHIALIEYKGNMFKKIFNRIRQFFRV